MDYVVRNFKPEDRDGVRHICCETGLMGDPVDRLFSDRELFADFFTRYYTDYEPESAMVAESEGRIVGYILGCLRYRVYPFAQSAIIAGAAPKAIARACSGKYDRQSLSFLTWFITRSAKETPRAPRRAAHFHFNLLPEWRDGRAGRRLYYSFMNLAKRRKVRRVFGQIQTYEDKRANSLFERFGFKLFDKKRVTKFERFGKKGVYVCTYVRDFAR